MSPIGWIIMISHWLVAHPFVMQLLVLVMIAILLQISASLAYRYFFKKFAGSRFIILDALLHSLRKPLTLIIWYFALVYIIEVMLELIHYKPLQVTLNQFFKFGIIISALCFLLHLISQIQLRMDHQPTIQKRYDKTSVYALARLARIIVVTLAILCLMPVFGLPLATIYTVAGGLSIGISFAAQDLLKNIFGGFILYFERPFGMGDWIASLDKSIEGTVESIGWRTTTIRAFNTTPLYVANAVFSTVTIINYSRIQCWRLQQMIAIRYQDIQQIDNITKAIMQLLQSETTQFPGKSPSVNLIDLSNNALTLQVYAYVNTTDQSRFKNIQQELLIKIMAIIHKHDAQFVGQTQTLLVPEPITITTKEIK